MSVTIGTKLDAKIVHVLDVHDEGRRFRWTRYRWDVGSDTHYHDDWVEIPEDGGPLLFIPSGPDVDEIAVRDLTQRAMETRKKRKDRPKRDFNKDWHHFTEVRQWEAKGTRSYPVAKLED